MSIKSTHQVTREFAIDVIQSLLHNCTDEQIANILEEAIHNGFYNFEVVGEIDYDIPFYLDDISNLPEYNDAW